MEKLDTGHFKNFWKTKKLTLKNVEIIHDKRR